MFELSLMSDLIEERILIYASAFNLYLSQYHKLLENSTVYASEMRMRKQYMIFTLLEE